MAFILTSIADAYNYVFDELGDHRTKDWFLVKSPFTMLSILIGYHYFVKRIGPAFMMNRKPFNVDRLVQVYNIAQVGLCIWFVLQGFIYVYGPTGIYGFSCQGIDRSNDPMALKLAGIGWGYYMMKYLDLMDTVFFVLRKKFSQATFLHVYHHIGMVFLSWFGIKYLPGGQSFFIVFINSFVHAIMYFYYFLSNYYPEYKKQIWWKKYLTLLQMVQFVLIFIQFFRVLIDSECTYPRWPIFIFLPQDFIILYLFAQFYRKAYMTPKEDGATANNQREKKT